MPDRRGHGRLVQRFFLYFNMYYISNQGKKAVRYKGQKELFGAVQEVVRDGRKPQKGTRQATGPFVNSSLLSD